VARAADRIAAAGRAALSQDLARRAFDEAPAVAGRIDGKPFEWIMDADSRIGPVLEACVNGRYYWVPFARLAKVDFEAPTDLRDCVWTAANLTFANGGETVALVPTRYPGSQDSTDGLITLARKTEWVAIGADRWAGVGQRVLVTDAGEHDLMALRCIELDAADESADAAGAGEAA
jgi:type VI secretion system protein ImpE